MARFLLAVWPFPGHVHPTIAIAHALCARGHEVAFYTGRTAQRTIEDEGFKYFPFKSVDEERIYAIIRVQFTYFASLWDQIFIINRG